MGCQRARYEASRVYKVGDIVKVYLPGGAFVGKVRESGIFNDWSGVAKYRVDGDGFETITSARQMRPADEETP